MALFEARNIACQRGERQLFDVLNFSVASGEALVLTGANGSGKSTLLRVAAGLIKPAAGEFFWNGRLVRPHADQHRRRLLYLGHADALKANLTLRENLRFWSNLAGLPPGQATSAVEQALEEDHLWPFADLPARFLSAGQRRRLALSRLRLQPPSAAPLWLLDEPTNALDGEAKRRLLNLLRQHLAVGGLIILATHDPLPELAGRNLMVDTFASERADEPADVVNRNLGENA